MDWTLLGTFCAAVLAAVVSYIIWPKDRRALREVGASDPAPATDPGKAGLKTA